jgi:hypothetical protein
LTIRADPVAVRSITIADRPATGDLEISEKIRKNLMDEPAFGD